MLVLLVCVYRTSICPMVITTRLGEFEISKAHQIVYVHMWFLTYTMYKYVWAYRKGNPGGDYRKYKTVIIFKCSLLRHHRNNTPRHINIHTLSSQNSRTLTEHAHNAGVLRHRAHQQVEGCQKMIIHIKKWN